jgi:hypothetical protein
MDWWEMKSAWMTKIRFYQKACRSPDICFDPPIKKDPIRGLYSRQSAHHLRLIAIHGFCHGDGSAFRAENHCETLADGDTHAAVAHSSSGQSGLVGNARWVVHDRPRGAGRNNSRVNLLKY